MRLKVLRNILLMTAVGLFPLAGTQAEPAPSASAATPETAPAITVRAGTHPGFDRIVFDWPRSVTYHVQRDGNDVRMVFDAAAKPRFEGNMVSRLTRARGVHAETDAAGHLVVSFTIHAGAVLKDFTSDKSVVVDINGEDAPAPPAAKTETPPAKITEASARPEKTEAAAPNDTPSPPPALPVAAVSETPAQQAPNIAVPSVKPVATTAIPVTVRSANAPNLKVGGLSYSDITDTPLLVASLDAHTPTRAVVYQRGGYVYIVFDRKLTLGLDALTMGQQPLRVPLEMLNLTKFTGFRFPVLPNLDVRATLDGMVWKVYLSSQIPEVPVSATLVAQPDFALGARYLLPLPDAPEPVRLTDPVVGDDLILIPLAQSQAFSVPRRMADFSIIPAAQGLVIKPLTDTVTVHAVSDGIEISAEGGLRLSSAIDTGAAQSSAQHDRTEAAGKSIFDFSIWRGKPNETYIQTRQRLQQTIVDVPESERNRARLELARFYFAHGNGEEAVALLNWIAKEVPDIVSHSDFLALRGAALILSYRPADGLKDLDNALLNNQPEIELWQGVAYAEMRDWANAEEKFSTSETQLDGYPDPFYSRFSVLAIEAAFATGKDHEAAGWIDHLVNSQHSEMIKPALMYLQGVQQAKSGHASTAEDDWKQVAASGNHLYSVRARMALIDLGVSTGSLTAAQAADRLESLRFAWRGDDLELDILHRLGGFYIQAKNVKAGLNVLSEAVKLYPDSPMTPQIRSEMATVFHDIFLGDLGKDLTPLDALTLYQQYRDLMPTGKDGDAVIRNLSERLVAIDLLEQSGNLLEDLAKNRLQGADRAKVTTRLAAIRLLDHKPDDAIAALAISDGDPLTDELKNERVLLHARALSDLNREDEALAVLKDNEHQPAKMLRADIAMHAQHWADAAKTLLDLIGPPPPSGEQLTDKQAYWIVNCAIAYSLAGDQVGLDRLAIDYGAAMSGTSQNDTFRVLTEPESSSQLRDVAAAQSRLREVDMFQDFLNGFRKAADTPPPAAPAAAPMPAKKP